VALVALKSAWERSSQTELPIPTFFDPVDPLRLDGKRPVEDVVHGDVLVAPFLDPCRRLESPGREDPDQGSKGEDK
jgi:hypothetical protein